MTARSLLGLGARVLWLELRHLLRRRRVGATAHLRGHTILWVDDKRWVYADTLEPLPNSGGRLRPCRHCGRRATLGQGDIDPCLGVLPGVKNACCGHGEPSRAYIQFANGVTIEGFTVVRKLEEARQ